MFGLFVIISVATQFVTGINFADAPKNLVLGTSFSSVHSLVVGSPVTIRGELVGEVLKIDGINKDKSKKSKNRKEAFNVQISVKESRGVSSSAIALIATPISPSGVKQTSVIEILLPDQKSKNQPLPDKIRGFSSYKEFWLSPDIQNL